MFCTIIDTIYHAFVPTTPPTVQIESVPVRTEENQQPLPTFQSETSVDLSHVQSQSKYRLLKIEKSAKFLFAIEIETPSIEQINQQQSIYLFPLNYLYSTILI